MHLSDLIRPAELPERYTKRFIIGIGLCTAVELIVLVRVVWFHLLKEEGCEVERTRTNSNLWGWAESPESYLASTSGSQHGLSSVSVMGVICEKAGPLRHGPAVEKPDGGSGRGAISMALAAAHAKQLSQQKSHELWELQQSPTPDFRQSEYCCSTSTFQISQKLSLWFTLAGNCAGMGFLETQFHLR